MAVALTSAGRHTIAAPSTLFVPGGRFVMGSEEGRPDERPPHEAEVRPLRVGRTPVTNMEYAWFLAAGRAPEPPWWRDPCFWDPEQPVVGVTWIEATAYCGWLRETLGGRWRLPTEAEWEHAARGGLPDARTPWGSEVPRGEVPEPPLSGPRAVGRGTANGYGLLDVGTLVREWCFDWYAPAAYRTARRYDPRGPETGESRVSRGGSWRSPERDVLPSARAGLPPSVRAADFGFRVVREVP
ncbi:MAG TPA: SUMF1/EgtB/PvdO family nonheme iron enzyme [Vicinamibacteria bacterium]|nr:SUMF1/EgtB/PvdO family nonheme iron enzyme [Vicinamibacteria bacterium]